MGEGELVVGVGDEEYRLGKGDGLRFRGSIPHRYRNEGPGGAEAFQIMFYGVEEGDSTIYGAGLTGAPARPDA